MFFLHLRSKFLIKIIMSIFKLSVEKIYHIYLKTILNVTSEYFKFDDISIINDILITG